MALLVTEQAAGALKTMLEAQDPNSDQVLRLVSASDGSHTLELDAQKEEDQVVEHGGVAVLAVDPAVSEELADHTLELQETANGPSLTLHR